ncbi:hypothetical protein [Nocardioides bizhenqiangii]|uniref:Integral membrane protein n=1 Tax=Nocardioides bizhenqiangii TaxID=3095076 RepID=A0ABZ0ZL30_9ACTN|nr:MULTISPECIES: hypothetical protein [unclassified Nocardioides]MDZ5620307.1 hypothetical protein [Nocardioides sp. HM23]WQQ24681.1 hypothetical protein SHK19_11945 [Nocardioides sp. HM61]
MSPWVLGAVLVLCGITVIVLVVHLVRDRAAEDSMFVLLGVTELVLLGQLVAGCVALANTERDVDGTLFVSYLVGVALALPIGAFWSLAERTRAGTAVVLLAVLTVVALEVRLDAIWAGAA